MKLERNNCTSTKSHITIVPSSLPEITYASVFVSVDPTLYCVFVIPIYLVIFLKLSLTEEEKKKRQVMLFVFHYIIS